MFVIVSSKCFVGIKIVATKKAGWFVGNIDGIFIPSEQWTPSSPFLHWSEWALQFYSQLFCTVCFVEDVVFSLSFFPVRLHIFAFERIEALSFNYSPIFGEHLDFLELIKVFTGQVDDDIRASGMPPFSRLCSQGITWNVLQWPNFLWLTLSNSSLKIKEDGIHLLNMICFEITQLGYVSSYCMFDPNSAKLELVFSSTLPVHSTLCYIYLPSRVLLYILTLFCYSNTIKCTQMAQAWNNHYHTNKVILYRKGGRVPGRVPPRPTLPAETNRSQFNIYIVALYSQSDTTPKCDRDIVFGANSRSLLPSTGYA